MSGMPTGFIYRGNGFFFFFFDESLPLGSA